MKFVARFGGGLGDVFMKLYEHRLHNSLLEFKNLGEVDAVVCCSNPATKSVLESLNIFSNILYYDWEPHCTHLEDYLQQFPDAIDLQNCGYDMFSHISLSSFEDGNMHHYNYQLDYEEATILDSFKDLEYIVIHPSGGLQSIDGLDRQQYKELIEYVLEYIPSVHVVSIGSSHRRVWVDSNDMEFEESNINIDNPRFIDLTNNTSGALCANVVENANAFIGTHSAWINMFWFFKRPTVCIYSDTSDWGNWMDYQLDNGCRWGFYKYWCKAIPVGKDVNVESVAKLASNYIVGF